jgi:Uma2 family endonuclease
MRPPRALNVVRDPPAEEVDARIDWSPWYLTDEEDMGESNEQAAINDTLRSSLRVLAAERDWSSSSMHIGADQFFAWVEEEPLVRVSPDVYLLDNPPPPPLPASWQIWRGHSPPRFAVEVVSGDERHPKRWRKDYDQAPEKYAQLGTRELVIFDPQRATGQASHPDRIPLQHYRRDADGSFVRIHAGGGPIYCAEIDAWLFILREGLTARLRIARDAEARDRVPTEAERAEAERHRADAERHRADAERHRADAEQHRADAEQHRADAERHRADAEQHRAERAERESAALREELDRRRQGG